ncbi:MAG: membrane protein insertion efficiency factor YidD [Syntrophobacteraceae bacterium]|jgi:putative membrane protein insertion efficiency factor|nr:membrane protein insertion efficiency factor YidD [Syntrophobacteraceae bacterium]
MKGPKTASRSSRVEPQASTSCVDLVLLGAIRFYRKDISPIGGNRCGFSPSCSAFGYRALSDYGATRGILMTGDRLMRCNIWKKPGPDYTLLPNGKLYDPPSRNLPPGR